MVSELTGACTCATGTSNERAIRASNPSQTDLWYQMASSGSHERETAPRGYDWNAMKTGTQNVATLRLTGLLIAVAGPPGMSPTGTKSSHLGMSRIGAAGSVKARSWRGDVVRSGAGAILMKWVHSSLVIYPTELEKRHCHHLLVP